MAFKRVIIRRVGPLSWLLGTEREKQMPACTLSPIDRRHQIKVVGNDPVKRYGKKRYYTVAEVKRANERQRINIDFGCWSHAFFNSHSDFDEMHRAQGESCDYIAMKKEMAESVSSSSSDTWFDFDFDLSWLELPDIDFSIFDFLIFSFFRRCPTTQSRGPTCNHCIQVSQHPARRSLILVVRSQC